MEDRKQILILYAEAGLGHRSAALAVEAALRELHGDDCHIHLVNPLNDKHAPAMLRDSQADYDKMVRRLPDLYKLGYQASDSGVPSTLMESGLIVLLYDLMREVTRRYHPDAIVTTYPLYQAPLDALFTLTRRKIPLLTVVTDLADVHRLWFNTAVDYCLVPTPRVRSQAVDAGLAPEQVQVTGIPVSPDLAREPLSKASLRLELGWHADLTTLLVVGGKRVEDLTDVLRVINHSGLPLQLVVAAGGDEQLYDWLQATEWHLPAHVYNFVTDMPILMHAADLIASKAGGLIVTESLACGLPMLLVGALPGQEQGNAAYVVESGAGEKGEDPIAVLEILCHWMERDRKLLTERARAARSLGHPEAAYTVAELAWGAAQRGPFRKSSLSIPGRDWLTDLLNRNGITLHKRVE